MTVRPIIFSAPMVRALLDGRKTQTRRVLKPQPLEGWENQGFNIHGDALFYPPSSVGMGEGLEKAYEEWDGLAKVRHAPGDRLWVREGFALFGSENQYVRYIASHGKLGSGNRPSIHMPRWASRITLEVTGVRIQRVQEITPDDARAEGHPIGPSHYAQEVHDDAARDWFMDLWDSLNAKRGYGWDVNPWVVAITFTVHHRNVDRMEVANA